MWFFLLMIFSIPVYAEDLGSLYIYAGSSNPDGSYSMKTKIHILVTDPLGRQIGRNPFIHKTFNATPRTNYSVESVDDNEAGSPGPESIDLEIMQAIGGEYGITVFGIDNAKYSLEIRGNRSIGSLEDIQTFSSYITSGTTNSYSMRFNPIPGAPAPGITKTVTFDVLRNDVLVAKTLNQLSDDKFIKSLSKTIDLAEKLSVVCDKRKHNKDKGCEPAIAVLKLFIKRLEKANRKCDSKNPHACDEDNDWNDFDKEHRKDHDYDDFFKDWDKDDWQKDKKKCKRFITDEALKIIREDAQWLIKSLSSDSTQISLSPDPRMPASPSRA